MLGRENTEGEYAGLEHEVVPDVVESLKIITEVMHSLFLLHHSAAGRLARPQLARHPPKLIEWLWFHTGKVTENSGVCLWLCLLEQPQEGHSCAQSQHHEAQ